MDTFPETPYAKAEMLIRRPVAQVFAAFIDPAVTTRFWFTKSTGKLVAGGQVSWTWEMYGHTTHVLVTGIEENKKILIDWFNGPDKTTVAWTFRSLNDQETFVSIVNKGFTGEAAKIIDAVRDSTEGFTLVLAGLKAYLEHHIELNLVADRFPEGI